MPALIYLIKMSKLKTSAAFAELIAAAPDTTDFKKLLQEAIASLKEGEVVIIDLNNKALLKQSEVDQLNATITSTQELILELQETNQKLTFELETKGEDLDAALEQVSELGKQLDLQQKNTDGSLIVTVLGVAKKIVGNRFHFKGEERMDAKALSQRPDLLEKMVKMQSASLVDLEVED